MSDEHDDLIDSGADEAIEAHDAFDDGPMDDEGMPPGEIDAEALLAEARDDELRVKAAWHLLPRENFVFLFCNCLFFAGALSAWTRMIPPAWLEAAGKPIVDLNPSMYITGLDTIRGTLIFALALYGFFQVVFNIVGRTTKVWPFVLNALIALEVGIGGLSKGFGGDAMDMANEYLKNADKTLMDDITVPLSAIPPAYWMLTLGGMIVVIVLINGIMTGAKKAKMSAAAEAESRRRR